MKEIQFLILWLALAGPAIGQGTMWGRVNFNNTSTTLITTNTVIGGPATGSISLPAGSYYFLLFAAPVGTTDRDAFISTGAYATNLASAGRIAGGNAEIPGATGANVFALFVRGWSANLGHDYANVTNYLADPTFDAWYGESEIGTIQPSLPEGPYPSLFGLGVGQIRGFNLNRYGVPEPSVLTLAGLGLAIWMLRRRSH